MYIYIYTHTRTRKLMPRHMHIVGGCSALVQSPTCGVQFSGFVVINSDGIPTKWHESMPYERPVLTTTDSWHALKEGEQRSLARAVVYAALMSAGPSDHDLSWCAVAPSHLLHVCALWQPLFLQGLRCTLQEEPTGAPQRSRRI